jgi:hypothetical protein
MAPTPSLPLRLKPRELEQLDALADELKLNRTDTVRTALRALRQNPGLRRQALAESLARDFLERLREKYGVRAQLGFLIGQAGPPQPTIYRRAPGVDGQRIPPDEIAIELREGDDVIHVDLIDPMTGVVIRNAYWTEAKEHQVFVPLAALYVYAPLAIGAQREVVRLHDGRTAVEIEQEDGSLRRVVLDENGHSRLLHDEQRAEWR